jgi:hypothetical protein
LPRGGGAEGNIWFWLHSLSFDLLEGRAPRVAHTASGSFAGAPGGRVEILFEHHIIVVLRDIALQPIVLRQESKKLRGGPIVS